MDLDFGIQEFGIAMGLAEEISDEEKERYKLEKESDYEDHEHDKVCSVRARKESFYSEELDKFQQYVNAVIRGEVELSEMEWNIFNRKG